MAGLREWSNRLLAIFRRPALDREIDEELATHISLLADENERRGMSREAAVRAARVAVGNVESNKEIHRDARGLPVLETFLQDLRYGLRTLRRDAAFSAFAILIVGLGIGASATVYSVVHTLLFRPLPFDKPEQLAWIANQEAGGLSGQTTQVDHMLDLRRESKSFSAVGGYMAFYGTGDYKLTGDGEPQRLSGVSVTQNFFELLGVAPVLGRTFNDQESRWQGPKAVLLSNDFWKRRFNSDPEIINKTIRLNDEGVPVIGVLPASFDFGAIFAPGRRFEVVSVFPLTPETNRWGNTLAMVGRLRPGVSVREAQAETTLLARRFVEAHKNDRNNFIGFVKPLGEQVSGSLRPALGVLVLAVGAVMLIVCANLSSLLLGRTVSRQKEIAIRAALGAGRARLIRQMLTESLLLSLCGATLGLLITLVGVRAIASIQSLSIPLLQQVRLDAGAFAFILVVAVIAGLAFGLLPAVNVKALALHDSLKDSIRGSSHSRDHAWMRKALVVAEVAFACVLLVSAGLLIRSLFRVLETNLGFRPENTLAVRVDPDSRYKTFDEQNIYISEVLRLVREIPGVTGAGLADALPFGMNRTWGAPAEGVQYTRENFPFAFPHMITGGYFQALGVALLSGRDFNEHDTAKSEPVIIINESLARTLWPGQDPLGKRIRTGGPNPRRVVGVVGDVRHIALEQGGGNQMYIAMPQIQDRPAVDLIVRSSLAQGELASRVRQALKPVEPNLAGQEFRTMQDVVNLAVSPRRFLVLLLAGFSLFALILASLGVYAVISYSVSQRTQELGIRLALGASPSGLERGILFETFSLAGIGMLAGIALSVLASRGLQTLLYEVKPGDVTSFAGAFGVVFVVALVAGYLPARRASQIDPSSALRTG